MPSRKLPRVSFIIPTLNAAVTLPRCLRAIRSQDYPQENVEIIVADAYSTDKTRRIAGQFKAKVIDNPEILHEPGKTLASKKATGDLLFFTDADNILAGRKWLANMVRPYLEQEHVLGFLPQTTAPPDSSGLNRYLGYLFTDPLTWFIYGAAANPHDYKKIYTPVVAKKDYEIYQFTVSDHPLFGLSQGSGIARSFDRGGLGHADDILSGIKLVSEGGLVAYVPAALVYHYHVGTLADFWKKYRWRVRNNIVQSVKGMGLVNRLAYFNRWRKLKLILFIPYSLSLIFPLFDAIQLSLKWRDPVMFWHVPACFYLALIIGVEYTRKLLGLMPEVGTYGK